MRISDWSSDVCSSDLRPGWHIECSAMIEAHLGETIDIHAGGLDLIFPHHENEIAQSRCAHNGVPLARFWLHNGFLSMRSDEHTSELQSLMRISYAVFCLKKTKKHTHKLRSSYVHY